MMEAELFSKRLSPANTMGQGGHGAGSQPPNEAAIVRFEGNAHLTMFIDIASLRLLSAKGCQKAPEFRRSLLMGSKRRRPHRGVRSVQSMLFACIIVRKWPAHFVSMAALSLLCIPIPIPSAPQKAQKGWEPYVFDPKRGGLSDWLSDRSSRNHAVRFSLHIVSRSFRDPSIFCDAFGVHRWLVQSQSAFANRRMADFGRWAIGRFL